ncbi:MAG: helix-turn-helix domain-containing protein [Planctomycetota bacterium]
MSPRQPHFTPKQVAEALMVSTSSVKRWCDRGEIPIIKTLGGHRRITLEGVQHFLRHSGRTLHRPGLLGMPGDNDAAPPVLRKGSLDTAQTRFRQALLEADEATCRHLVQQEIRAGRSRCETAEWFIADAMSAIGDAWENDSMEPYVERRSAAICVRLIEDLRREVSNISPSAPIAIGAAPEGDRYQLPTALVELSLREHGWNATNLGVDLPWDTLLQAVRDYRPKMLWLSISTIADEARFIDEQRRLFESIQSDTVLFVGGRALTDDLRPKLSFTVHCDHIRHLVELSNMVRLGSN